MNIKDLHIFMEVAEQQNISKAAVKFNYVQSNITNRMAKLEQEIGHQLFIRSNKGVLLTKEGKTFSHYAAQMLHLHKEAIEALQEHEVKGLLQIGATDITTATRLPKMLTIFLKDYPQVDLTLKNGSTSELVEDVLQFKIDGAFITNPTSHDQLVFERFLTEELVLVSNKPLAQNKLAMTLEQQSVLVFRNGCTYRGKMEQWLREEGIVTKTIEFGTIEGMLGCVKAGLGVALISKHLAKNHQEELYYYPVPEPYRFVEIGFVYRKNNRLSKALEAFLECGRAVLGANNDHTRNH